MSQSAEKRKRALSRTLLASVHQASARATNLPVSTKHSVEISNYLRYKDTSFAKKFLEEVITLKKAVPFKYFTKDLGHKPGMAAGRYPQKAAQEFLRLIKAVEANAQGKGLNTANLKIVKILANKASIPFTGGRLQRGKKRTHLEVVVKERQTSPEKKSEQTAKRQAAKTTKTTPSAEGTQ